MRGFEAVLAMASLGLAGMAAAEPVDGKTARALAFKPKGVEVTLLPLEGLSEQDVKALTLAAEQQPYYAAVALAPSEGLMSTATVAAANYHDVASAGAAALAACNAARKGGTPCVIAAEVRPRGWEPRALSLSADATVGLRKDYGRARGEKALAISPATGKWAVGKGAGAEAAALATCAAHPGATDCTVVVADR